MKEPFLINPRLGILNPRRKKARVNIVAARKRKYHVKRTNPRRRRKNPYPVAGVVVNPRRRRRNPPRRRRRNPVSPIANARRYRRRMSVNPRRRHVRRNPSIMGFSLPVNKIVYAGAGFVGTPILEGFVNGFLPASLTSSTIGKYAIKLGCVFGLAYAVRKFIGIEQSTMVAVGGGIYVATSALSEFAGPEIKGYLGIKGYVTPNRQLGSYVRPNQRVNNALGSYNTAPNTIFGNSGNMTDVAKRFQRY